MAQDRARVAVVVNQGNPARDITLPALRDFFQCEKLYWRTGERAMVFTRQVGSPEHQVMLRAVYKMNQSDYEKLWVMKQMRGETSCRITELPSKGIVQEGLRTYPGAIALVRDSDLTPDMKVLTVNGKFMQDADYPLQ
jgi:hypothetical protein